MNATTAVRIVPCTAPDELHHHYPTEDEAQPCHIALSLREGTLSADWAPEVGEPRALPEDVPHGLERRYEIPTLTGDAANRAMEEIKPLAGRILADWQEIWDGQDWVARLGPDAVAAEEAILGHLDGFTEADQVAVWDVAVAVDGSETEEYGITPGTTDERLEEIEASILSDLAECSASTVIVCAGLGDHLRRLRDTARDTDPDA